MKIHKLCLALALLVTTMAIGTATAAPCNNATVNGVWGYQVGGAVGQFTSDGNGNITGSQMVTQNGVISTQTYAGTYSVSTRCIGAATVNLTGGGTAHTTFILDNGRKGAQMIDTDTGITANGPGMTQGVVSCGLTGTRATFAANLMGKILPSSPVAYTAQVTLDGSGHLSGSGTFIVNGAVATGSISGTYTEASDCTGTVQMSVSGFSSLNFFFVVANSGKEIFLLETDANTEVAGNMQQ